MSYINYIKQMALNLKIEITDKMANDIDEGWVFFHKSLKIINAIDTKDAKLFSFPNIEDVDYLREDIVIENDFDNSVIFKNAKNIKENYIWIKEDENNYDKKI